jgi:hypothetical protein
MNVGSQGFYLDSNEDSWLWVVKEIEEYPNTEYWISYKDFARPVIKAGIDTELHQHFRAGFSMEHIIFSTADRRLELYDPPIPRVTLIARSAPRQIAWSRQNLHFHEPERSQVVDAENAFVVLKSFLIDLWRETRQNENLPKALQSMDG